MTHYKKYFTLSVDDGLQHIADIIGKALVFLFAYVQLGVQHIAHTEHIADVQIDAEGGDNIPLFIPEIRGGGFEGAPVLGVGHVCAGVAVGGQLLQGFQPGIGSRPAHGAVCNVSVGDGNDGVVIVLRQVVEDHLAGWAELICDAVTEQLDVF